jgi:hypothetical protein
MAGLDPALIDQIDWDAAGQRILVDIRTDFLIAPHFTSVFENNSEGLQNLVKAQLRSGQYFPSLPILTGVPKERGFTRPGAILSPPDRLIYHALVDLNSSTIESQFDRTRSFSHVRSDDPSQLANPNHDSWGAFQGRLIEMCDAGGVFVKADVANYFERIPQHHLINLLSAAGCPAPSVRLLEEMLLAFQERNSFGIPQGIHPSDVIGNYYLTELDAFYSMQGIDSARYVDDLYLRFGSQAQAQEGLAQLADRLRRSGLHLNEHKSGVFSAEQILREETTIDDLFDAAREEAETELSGDAIHEYYGLASNWEQPAAPEAEIELEAVKRLFEERHNHPTSWEKIVRYCLPTLAAANSDYAIDMALDEILDRPHLSRAYLSYLRRFANTDARVASDLSDVLLSEAYTSDYQTMYVFGTLLTAPTVTAASVDFAVRSLMNRSRGREMRALAAIYACRHGTAAQKRMVRTSYEDEPSEYVRWAILHGSQYFTPAEKATCTRAWGGHNAISALIAATI